MFQMHNHDYCDEEKMMGTFIATVPDFLTGWLQEKEQQAADNGNDDYAAPDVAQYVQCTPFEIQGVYYYMQLGCADGVTNQIAVNIYSDNTCTKRSLVDGSDDAAFDVSDLQVSVLFLVHGGCFGFLPHHLVAQVQILPKVR